MAPHLVWLVENDFLPFAYANARAAPVRGLLDHVGHPPVFAIGQAVFLMPALLIAPRWFGRGNVRRRSGTQPTADAFDQRIVALLAFGPAATTMAFSALSGRGTIAMWGYPLWLFLGLCIVLWANTALDPFAWLASWGHGPSCLRSSGSFSLPAIRFCRHSIIAIARFLSRRSAWRRACAPVPRGDRKAACLCHRRHVGRRQCRPLRQEHPVC